jgi:hypothetical protein
MAFHLPFFALRKAPLPSTLDPKVRGKRLRSWKILSLLGGESSCHNDQETYRLYPVQVSCAVYGSYEWKYTVCEFVDTEHDSNDGCELYDWHDDENDAQELDQDPILSNHSVPVQASSSIWRPRQYFIKALETAIEEVSEEWDRLVYKLEVDKAAYVCVNSHQRIGARPSTSTFTN